MTNATLVCWMQEAYLNAETKTHVERYADHRRVVFTTDRHDIASLCDSIEVVLGDFPRDLLPSLPNLIWFQQFGTGVEWLRSEPRCVAAPFILTSCSDDHYAVVADHAFALLLACTRNIPQYVNAQSNTEWAPPTTLDSPRLSQLNGKTLLMVGLGSIGKEIAKRARAFGLKTNGVKRDTQRQIAGISNLFSLRDLSSAVKQADIVIACLPDTPNTNKVFDDSIFKEMRSSAIFINVGRGYTVNETALCNALKSQRIAAAAIDVTKQEPLAKDSELWKCPNLLITPHVAGHHNQVLKLWRDVALENLERFSRGVPLRNTVNKQLGY